jgi:hypothetical protein
MCPWSKEVKRYNFGYDCEGAVVDLVHACEIYGPELGWSSVMTVRLGLLFSFYLFPFPPLLLYYGHSPFVPCNSLELDLPSDTKARTRCLADCALSPLSITCLTLAFTVLPTRASVPADVHPLCPLCARISSPLPYVPLHRLCMLSGLPTCVTPRPLYAFS